MNARETEVPWRGLRGLQLETEYRTAESDLIRDFYRPCLARSDAYDRAVGYFRSSIYVVTGDAVVEYARRGGRMRVVCSPTLTADDLDAINRGVEQHSEILGRAFSRDVEELLDSVDLRQAASVLATLVAVGTLELRIAVRVGSTGIYHEKIGVFHDRFENLVSFKGSANETWNGWHAEGNIESIEVFCSWRPGIESERVAKHDAYFQRLWEGQAPQVRTITVPESVKSSLLKIAKPNLEELNRLRSQSTISKREPLAHQLTALASWRAANSRGILEHATGSGKTFTALTALREHVTRGRVGLVLVPSRLLLRQWASEIAREIPDAVVLPAGAGRTAWREPERLERFSAESRALGPRIVLATMQTARSDAFLQRFRGGDHVMIVADEVHQAGSAKHSRLFEIQSGPRLGLSATPKRYGDPEGTARILDYFGGIVPPPVTLVDAIASGRLVRYEYHPHAVSLTDSEADEWRSMTQRVLQEVARSRSRDGESAALSDKAKLLLIQRARIAKRALNKIRLGGDVLTASYREGQRWLVYCEDTSQLVAVRNELSARGLATKEYHSDMPGDPEATLAWFRKYGGILVSIRCLDEGVDIPEVSHALILASSQNPRQFIQRRGRVLRAAADKAVAVIHDALVLPVDVTREPDQTALVRGELRRAMEFARSALNRSAEADLREMAMRIGVDPEHLTDVGLEEEDEDG